MPQSSEISLCMIVRNEAEFLPASLQSVRDVVDEIIVVDTGSTDSSPQIAREFGARVVQYKWNDDFSEARNFSLQQASGNWIFVLDADELIAERDRRQLLELVHGQADGYLFTYRSYCNNSQDIRWRANDGSYIEGAGWDGWIEGRVVRCFRRDERFRFAGAVHEAVDASICRCGGKVAETDIIIHHFHEKKGKERLREKQLHYLRLYEKNLHLLPPHAKTCFDMGLIYRHLLHDLARAKALQEQALEINPECVEAKLELTLLCHLLNESAAAAQHLEGLLKKNPRYAPAWLLCAIILGQNGKSERAVECYERSLALNPHLVDARVNLGTFRAKLGDFEGARREWITAFRMNPSNGKLLLNLGALELREGNFVLAKEYLEKAVAVSPEYAPAWNNLGVLYAETGDSDASRAAFERAVSLAPAR